MSRRRKPERRVLTPDPKYHDPVVAKFMNNLMRRGKKSIAEGIFYGAMDIVARRTKEDPVKVFHQALDNVRPVTEVRSARVGGSTYQVPVEIRTTRQQALAMRWIIGYSKSRDGHSMSEKLGAEIIDAANNRGAAVKKREDTHKMAEANKAFSHYRW
jgi:small subunit ribosomal protein S7